jgi:PAS domain-containing protein
MEKNTRQIGTDFFEKLWEKSWTYIKTVVDVLREPILILDKDFKVVAANDSFYETFKVTKEDTENKILYDLGNGQWNIPALKKILETILSDKTFFKGFQVAHEFPSIGRRVMLLNAREIHIKDDADLEPFPPTIVLAMEDVTEMMAVADLLSEHAKNIEARLMSKTQEMGKHISALEEKVEKLKEDK